MKYEEESMIRLGKNPKNKYAVRSKIVHLLKQINIKLKVEQTKI